MGKLGHITEFFWGLDGVGTRRRCLGVKLGMGPIMGWGFETMGHQKVTNGLDETNYQ